MTASTASTASTDLVAATRHALSALTVAALLCGVPARVHAQDSVATAAALLAAQQLERGEQWFRARCLECHAHQAIANGDFQMKWDGRTAYELFERVRSSMPENDPGSLSSGTYTAIIAYLLKLNGMPVGATPLSSDSAALAEVRLSFTPAVRSAQPITRSLQSIRSSSSSPPNR